MGDFKVGDIVECVDNETYTNLYLGGIYTIESISLYHITLSLYKDNPHTGSETFNSTTLRITADDYYIHYGKSGFYKSFFKLRLDLMREEKFPPTTGLNPSGISVKLFKYKLPPTLGLNPSGIEVKLSKTKTPTTGLNPFGIEVKLFNNKLPPTLGLNPYGIEVKSLKSKLLLQPKRKLIFLLP